MSKKSVAVRIAGHNYKILSDGDADSLRKVASYVDQAMDRVRERTRTVDTLDVSVLTCLNLAREILALRDQENVAVEDERMRSLIDRVETILGREGADTAGDAGEAEQVDERESARTLDLPSVESLRNRATASSNASAADSTEAPIPEARVAAGGRERAS
jgi:cell division protein ZapA (FtsZ GTPase activity inhibitor)